MSKSRNNKLCKVADVVSVNIETGEQTPVEGRGAMMLPGPPGSCEWCHVEHDPAEPHDQQSLPYQMKFKAIKGRWPTWSDAMAHCTPEVRQQFRQAAREIMAESGMEIPADLRDE